MIDIATSTLREIAHRILMSHVEDIEWLSIYEITQNNLESRDIAFTDDELEEIVHQVDAWLNKAEINIVFKEVD